MTYLLPTYLPTHPPTYHFAHSLIKKHYDTSYYQFVLINQYHDADISDAIRTTTCSFFPKNASKVAQHMTD